MIINRVVPLLCTSVDAATLDPVVFASLKTLEEPALYLKIVNDSDTAVSISYDGTTVHDYIMSHDNIVINAQTNSIPRAYQACFAKGITISLRGIPGVGRITCTAYTTYQ